MKRYAKALAAAALALTMAVATTPTALQAATPDDTLVIAKNIDDIISLDPAQVFEFTGGEVVVTAKVSASAAGAEALRDIFFAGCNPRWLCCP